MQQKLEGFQSNRKNVTTSPFLWLRMTYMLLRCSLQNRPKHIPELHQNQALAQFERGHPELVAGMSSMHFTLLDTLSVHLIFLLCRSITCAVFLGLFVSELYSKIVEASSAPVSEKNCPCWKSVLD